MHSPRDTRHSNGSSNGDGSSHNYKDEPNRDNRDNYKDDEDRDFERKMRSPPTSSESPPNTNTSSDNNDQNKGNTLHVSNLNPRTRESDLRDTFASIGKVIDCIILLDPNTKESRGFGFVTYSSGDEAQDAIQRLDSTKIDGNAIRVEKSKRSKARDPTPGFYMGSERKKRPYGNSYGGPNQHHHMRGDPRGNPYGSYPGYPGSYSKYPMAPPPYGGAPGMGYYNYPPSYPSYPSYPTYPKYNNDSRYSPYGRRGGNDDRDSRRSSSSSSSSSHVDHHHHDRDRRSNGNDDRGRDSRDYYRRD
ncbi:hypothetical protein ACTFIU_004496 [Dictyostelium citrinum]